jgi:hypothetical protein
MASNIKPPRSLDEQNIFHTLPTELSILNRAHDARFGTYECLKLDDLYAWRAEQTFFYVYGLKCLGKARLKEPKIFFERELSRDVRFNFVVYHDEPYNERSPSWKTALLGLREIIDWKHGEPQGVEIALAYMALAEIKLHRGIPIGWYDLDELGIRHKGSMVLPGAVPNSCEVYSPDDRDMRMFIDYAIASLEHACEQNDPLALWLHRLPIFKPLRDEATFKDLIARLTLP